MNDSRAQLLARARIDLSNLTLEWQKQPERVFGAELMAADANLSVAQAKLALEVREADLGKKFRAFGIQVDGRDIKVTEGAIQEAIKTDPTWVELVADLQAKQYHHELVRGILSMERTKLMSLKYLTTLTAPFKDDDPEADEIRQKAAATVAAHASHAAA